MKQQKKSEHLWTSGAILIFIVLLLVGYRLKDSISSSPSAIAPVNPSCDLHQGKCTTLLANGASVSLLLTPQTIRVLHPLSLNVVTDAINVSTINVDFRGIDMDMGYNRLTLSQEKKGSFVGETILPACIQAEMKWEARVLLNTKKGVIMVPFQFSTRK
jgi:zona occludens toxin (predicted ATPase)